MLDSWYRRMENRIYNMIARATVTKMIDDGPQLASMTVSEGDDYRDIERVQNYGFTGFPGPNADAIIVCPTGSREYPILISVDHPASRLKLEPWESALYTKMGTKVHLKADESIEVLAKKSFDVKSENSSLDFGPELTIKAKKTTFTSDTFSVKNAAGDDLVKLQSEVLDQLIQLVTVLIPASGLTAVQKATMSTALSAIKTKLTLFSG